MYSLDTHIGVHILAVTEGDVWGDAVVNMNRAVLQGGAHLGVERLRIAYEALHGRPGLERLHKHPRRDPRVLSRPPPPSRHSPGTRVRPSPEP